MNEFDQRLAAGVEDLRRHLAAEGREASEIGEIAERISSLAFPGLLAFLGSSGEAAGESARPQGDRDGGPPGAGGLRDRAMRGAVSEMLAAVGLPASEEEVRRVAALLSSGEFYRDVEDATAVILHTVPNLPVALVADVNRWDRTFRIPRAVARDLDQGFFGAAPVARDLLDGRLDRTPRVLRHTLRALYETATLGSIVRTIRALIAPEAESVRLAVVLYARANGVDLQPGDLDVLRDSLFATDDPDLGPALVAALKRLEKGAAGPAGAILALLSRRDSEEEGGGSS